MNRAVSSCGRSMRSRKIDTGKGKAKSRMKSHLPLSLKLAIWCRAALRTLSSIARMRGGENSGLSSARKTVWSGRSEEHTYELQSLMRISYAGYCLQKKKKREEEEKNKKR